MSSSVQAVSTQSCARFCTCPRADVLTLSLSAPPGVSSSTSPIVPRLRRLPMEEPTPDLRGWDLCSSAASMSRRVSTPVMIPSESTATCSSDDFAMAIRAAPMVSRLSTCDAALTRCEIDESVTSRFSADRTASMKAGRVHIRSGTGRPSARRYPERMMHSARAKNDMPSATVVFDCARGISVIDIISSI